MKFKDQHDEARYKEYQEEIAQLEYEILHRQEQVERLKKWSQELDLDTIYE